MNRVKRWKLGLPNILIPKLKLGNEKQEYFCSYSYFVIPNLEKHVKINGLMLTPDRSLKNGHTKSLFYRV